MATRTIEGPGDSDSPTCTTEQAALWLGVSVKQFGRLVGLGAKPDKAEIPGVRQWVRPIRRGSEVRWYWMAIEYLRYLLDSGAFGWQPDDEANLPSA